MTVSVTAPSEAKKPSISERLRAYAKQQHGVSEGDLCRLKDLATCLDGAGPAAPWAGVDLRRIFDGEAIAAGALARSQTPNWPAWLELVRNVLILAPVGWTWLGISKASTAYQETLTANPALGQQGFLLLWQRDFYGRLPWLPFSTMALVDALLVAGIIALTLILHTWATQTAQAREEALASARRDFDDVLADAALRLAAWEHGRERQFLFDFGALGQQLLGHLGQESERLDRLTTERTELLAQLAAERERIVRLADERDQQVASLTSFAGGLADGVGGILEASRTFGRFHDEQKVALEALRAAVAGLANGQQALADAGQRVGGQLAAFTSEIQGMAGALGEALGDAVAAETELRQAAAVLTGSADRLATTLPQTLTALDRTAGTLGSAVGSLTTSAAGIAASVEALSVATTAAAARQEELTAAQHAVGADLGQLVREQQTVGEALGLAMHAATDANRQVARVTELVTTLAGELQAAQRQYLDELRVERTTQQLRGAELLQELVKLSAALGAAQTNWSALEQDAADERAGFLQALIDERTAQADLARTVAEATISVGTGLSTVHEQTTNLIGLAMGMDDLARSLPLVVREFRAAMNDITSTHATTAQQLAGAGVSVQANVQGIGLLIDTLQGAVDRLTLQCGALAEALEGLRASAASPNGRHGAGAAASTVTGQ